MTYEEICDFAVLYAAYVAARKGKRKKTRTIEFEENLLENLRDILDDLAAGTYLPGEFERFKIFEPKERDIEAPAFKDKVVLHAVADNGLKLNSKTAIFPIRNGVDFLGFHTYLTESGKVVQKLRRTSIQRIEKRIKRWRHDFAEGKISAEKIKERFASWDSHAAYGDTRELRKKYAKEVSDIIGEPVEIHRKLNSTRIQRERRRAKQQRCITAKRQRSLARQASYRSPDLPPWE